MSLLVRGFVAQIYHVVSPPLSGSVVLAIALMPIILPIFGSVLFLSPSIPFASAHQIHRLAVGICFIVSCDAPMCCLLSPTVYRT